MARVLEMLQLYLQLLAVACITTWAPPSIRSVVALDSHRDVKTNFRVKAEYTEIATNRNKVYNEYSVLNQKLSTKPVLGAKNVGDTCYSQWIMYYFVVPGH